MLFRSLYWTAAASVLAGAKGISTLNEQMASILSTDGSGTQQSVRQSLSATAAVEDGHEGYITVEFIGDFPERGKPGFNYAASKLNSILEPMSLGPAMMSETSKNDLCLDIGGHFGDPDLLPGNISAGVVSNLTIFAIMFPIDGPGLKTTVLAQAGACNALVAGPKGKMLPLFGVMVFDTDDVDLLLEEGNFDSTVTHEMMHVLGFGNNWETNDLLVDGNTPNARYNGSFEVLKAYKSAGGKATMPEVEDMGGEGTQDAHWRTSVMGDELMTGALTGKHQPLSMMTALSLEDLGYIIDKNSTSIDAYELPDPNTIEKVDWPGSTVQEPPLIIEGQNDIIKDNNGATFYKVDYKLVFVCALLTQSYASY